MTNVQNGTIKPKARQIPSFLFPNNTVYDPKNLQKGLFRGHVVVRVSYASYSRIALLSDAYIECLRAIYTGKSSIVTGHRDAQRPSAAEIVGITEVTAHMAVYAACQVCSCVIVI